MNVQNVQYEGESIEYVLIQSRRKTISITVEPDQKVLVKAPDQVSREEIQHVVQKKAPWIIKKRRRLANQSATDVLGFTEGRQLWYQGKAYFLKIYKEENQKESKQEAAKKEAFVMEREREKRHGRVALLGEQMIVYAESGQGAEIRKHLLQWYYQQAGQRIAKLVENYSSFFEESVNRISIKDQKSLWGSCSSKRNLNFNWRLIMAPPQVLRYVVVHEMCHLKHMNHSKEFWKEVADILPDYQEWKRWLRKHGDSLMSF